MLSQAKHMRCLGEMLKDVLLSKIKVMRMHFEEIFSHG